MKQRGAQGDGERRQAMAAQTRSGPRGEQGHEEWRVEAHRRGSASRTEEEPPSLGEGLGVADVDVDVVLPRHEASSRGGGEPVEARAHDEDRRAEQDDQGEDPGAPTHPFPFQPRALRFCTVAR